MEEKKYYVGILVVFIIIIISYSLLPFYSTVTPELADLPFFYWYQIALLVVTTILLSAVAYLYGGDR